VNKIQFEQHIKAGHGHHSNNNRVFT